jgi:uncharacterized protein YaaN involved in tellurite resistance
MTRKEQLEEDKASIERYIKEQQRDIEALKKEIYFAQKRLKLVNEHIESISDADQQPEAPLGEEGKPGNEV